MATRRRHCSMSSLRNDQILNIYDLLNDLNHSCLHAVPTAGIEKDL